ncbi:MAG TPA: (2Fe-2S) ferredoxin domain-containing protein [Candidatus Hydrogenedentes bacterium]|nr:(2Fe-2S) ferredoxin domain-containing protein [Candidatus Hydrogenedentota bacterium]
MANKIKSPQDLLALKEKAQAEIDVRAGVKDIQITVHMGTCGIAAGAREVLASLVKELDAGAVKNATLRQTGCAGLCDREPMLTLTDKAGQQFRYGKLDPKKVHRIVRQHVVEGTPVIECLISNAK